MFTGLITHIGMVSKIKSSILQDNFLRINIKWQYKSLLIGSSVCCNGVCLTVIQQDDNYFSVNIVRETLDRSGLKNLSEKTYINLERAMKISSRLNKWVNI